MPWRYQFSEPVGKRGETWGQTGRSPQPQDEWRRTSPPTPGVTRAFQSRTTSGGRRCGWPTRPADSLPETWGQTGRSPQPQDEWRRTSPLTPGVTRAFQSRTTSGRRRCGWPTRPADSLSKSTKSLGHPSKNLSRNSDSQDCFGTARRSRPDDIVASTFPKM